MNKSLLQITNNIIKKSQKTRTHYLKMIDSFATQKTNLGCANLAHSYASLPNDIKDKIIKLNIPNIGIISSYNDMLSAHAPYKTYPDIIKQEAYKHKTSVQFAGATAAMCDGITQGFLGMELSLFSRDNIAMSVAIALSHNVFDGAIYLGVCDKIVPGLLIGALRFGHLPSIFIPSGPMISKISNSQKAKTRELFAQGKIQKEELLKSEMDTYHDIGTCTFYGTANSNQVMVEMLGLHMPNSAFINPKTKLKEELIKHTTSHFINSIKDKTAIPLGHLIDEKSIVNAIVGLMATGGSTNHSIHLVAIARACGIVIDWDDFDALSHITPLLAKIYPNGSADINDFYKAGGLGFIIRELLKNGLLHEDVNTIMGKGLSHYTKEPTLKNNTIKYTDSIEKSRDEDVLRSFDNAFMPNGGLKVMKGNIGRSIIKVSALSDENKVIKAPAIVFSDQKEVLKAFDDGLLNKDFVAVVKYQGPRANGMPELHKLIPQLSVLIDKGYKVALITDGRMSGASGKVPAAIHTSPEAMLNGNINKIKTGDMIYFDAQNGILDNLEKDFLDRDNEPLANLTQNSIGMGRELFECFRNNTSSAEMGAMSFGGIFL